MTAGRLSTAARPEFTALVVRYREPRTANREPRSHDVYGHVIRIIDVPQRAAAWLSRQEFVRVAVERDLLAISLQALRWRLAALVIDHCVDAVLANHPVETLLHDRSAFVGKSDWQLAPDRLRSRRPMG